MCVAGPLKQETWEARPKIGVDGNGEGQKRMSFSVREWRDLKSLPSTNFEDIVECCLVQRIRVIDLRMIYHTENISLRIKTASSPAR